METPSILARLCWPISLLFSIAIIIGLVLLSRRFSTKPRGPISLNSPDFQEVPEKNVSTEIPAYICASDNDKIRRDQWVGRLAEYAFRERHRGRYNVLVIHDSLEYYFNSNSIEEDKIIHYSDPRNGALPYRLLVFHDGEVVNFGDGGYINWTFWGDFTQHGVSSVTFHPKKKDVES
ncbi:stress protein [Colletotrichum asianum]|uniref:Stress response protein yvgo n=1 Tax=Colletotrichum asianum TaxID=702518 RepID=A0A8H3WB59_9PEZI|nr:stress response protein yvgo [Colletotrichum asianum]